MIALAEIERARERIAGAAVRTPLVRLHADAPAEIWLKLENLQPIGSFKIRGATNAIRAASPEDLAGGVVTASAGNMAQGVAWAAREAGVPATIVVPDHAPQTKLDAIERLGGRILKVPYEQWWQAIEESRFEGADGLFVHPVQDELVMAGNGTIGLELIEDLPDVDTVLIPFGGGGLSTGIASAVKQLRPETRVFAVEPETAAAVSAAFAAGGPAEIEYTPSFVDGAGARKALPAMWPLVSEVIDGAHVATLDETAAAIRQEDYDRVYTLFPRLHERRSQLAGTLSGGEQQMVAMARALMSRPKLMLMDEPSMGLAPILVEQSFEIIKQVHDDGMAVLVVEQNANVSLSIADRGYVLSTGRLVLEGKAADLLQDEGLRKAYLGR